MVLFILGLIIFFLPHLLTALMRDAREGLIRRLGAGRYKGLYSVSSAIGLALIIVGWPTADRTVLYVAPYWTLHIAYALTLAALILLAAAYLPRGKVAAAVKHPMLAGVKCWALAHLLVNGDVRSVLLFGSFLAYGVIDRIAVKRRGVATPAPGPIANDALAVFVGAAVWAAVYFQLHAYIAGVDIR
ncbi:MAG: NnrU family protein [Parvularculaceae bacterium]